MIYCEVCDKLIDTDFDAEHFDEHKITKGGIAMLSNIINKLKQVDDYLPADELRTSEQAEIALITKEVLNDLKGA